MSIKPSVRLVLLVTAFSLGGFAASAFATPITISNGSFELGILNNPGSFSTVNAPDNLHITDWTVSNGSVDYIGAYWQAQDGSRSLDMNGNAAGTIQQQISVPHAGNVTIAFWIAGNPDGNPMMKTMTVSLMGPGQVFTFDATGKTHANMGWESRAATFAGVTPGLWTLQFEGAAGNTFYGAALDNVSGSVTAVPDSGTTVGLLGLAMTGLGLLRRRMRV